MTEPLLHTDYPTLKFLKRGKVRDIYDIGEHLLIVATDRLSAFDVVMPQGIPCKGKVLTQISNFWFAMMKEIIPSHIVVTNVEHFPAECKPYADELRGRSIVVKKSQPLPIECVVRGYISGSGWNDYQATGTICGISLPRGLKESEQLVDPIFTPATKADEGHDENISFDQAAALTGMEMAALVREKATTIYQRATVYAAERGIIIADTKMEFGIFDGKLIIIDELLTPDSSRFWPADTYQPGRAQSSYDKQYVRDYLLAIKFNKQPPGPMFPDEVIEKTSELYKEAYRRLIGREID